MRLNFRGGQWKYTVTFGHATVFPCRFRLDPFVGNSYLWKLYDQVRIPDSEPTEPTGLPPLLIMVHVPRFAVPILLLFRLSNACYFSPENPSVYRCTYFLLANLQILTSLGVPFTYVETVSSFSDCTAAPYTGVEWRTAYVGDSTFTANTVTFILSEADTYVGSVFISYVYPDMILTILEPGQTIIQVSLSRGKVCSPPTELF